MLQTLKGFLVSQYQTEASEEQYDKYFDDLLIEKVKFLWDAIFEFHMYLIAFSFNKKSVYYSDKLKELESLYQPYKDFFSFVRKITRHRKEKNHSGKAKSHLRKQRQPRFRHMIAWSAPAGLGGPVSIELSP